MNNIHEQLLKKLSQGEKVALATIISSTGSTPQKAGCSAIFSNKGLEYGTLGGGILEGETCTLAFQSLKELKPRLEWHNLNNPISEEESAICGGKVVVLVDPQVGKDQSVFLDVVQSLVQHKHGVLVTSVSVSKGLIIDISRLWYPALSDSKKKDSIPSLLQERISSIISSNRPITDAFDTKVEGIITHYLLEHIFPQPHLVIAGAGHIGKALTHLGSLLDFSTTIIDDRSEYANRENIPDADAWMVGDIATVLSNLEISKDTFIVIVTRGHKQDADALLACINSQAGYIGMIGSRSKVAQMKAKFIKEKGISESLWNRIHSPVGLSIGSQTVQEIAVSIAAELIQVRNKNHE